MSSKSNILSVAISIAEFADRAQNRLRWFVLVGGIACVALAITVFNPESTWWWNAFKVGVLMLPALIWVVVLWAFSQLTQAPELVSELITGDEDFIESQNRFSVNSSAGRPIGLRSLFSAVRAFQQEEGFETVFDAISGISLIVNPFFALLAFLAMAVLFLFILIAPFIVLF